MEIKSRSIATIQEMMFRKDGIDSSWIEESQPTDSSLSNTVHTLNVVILTLAGDDLVAAILSSSSGNENVGLR
jgi:hypothetical protein